MQCLVPETIIVNHHRISYGIHGQGEPIILIHGTPSFSHIWRNVVPRLTSAGYQVYVYDLLGYGHSERPQNPNVDTSVSGQVPILVELMNNWGLQKSHIVAHDIGGAVAQRLGVYFPDRIKTLTLIDCVSYDSWPSTRKLEQMEKGLEKLISADEKVHRAHFSEWLLTTVTNKARFEKEALPVYLDMISGPVGQGSMFQHQVMHYDPKHTAELNERIQELGNHPVQLIWGEDDQWQVTDWAQKLHNAIPGSKLNILKDCGHFAMEDQPENISELIIQFAK